MKRLPGHTQAETDYFEYAEKIWEILKNSKISPRMQLFIHGWALQCFNEGRYKYINSSIIIEMEDVSYSTARIFIKMALGEGLIIKVDKSEIDGRERGYLLSDVWGIITREYRKSKTKKEKEGAS